MGILSHRPARLVVATEIGALVISSVTGLALSAPASAAVTATANNTAPPADTNGYTWVTYFRGLAGLGGVTRNATLESQEATHVQYLANHALACETDVHNELTARIGACGANRYATAAGKAAANNSDITRVSVNVSDRTAVANWFSSAFHALTLLDPRLASTGYAAYYTPRPTGAKPIAWNFTAGVDVYRGRTGRYNGATVAFPANNAATPLASYTVGTESPEPFRTATGPCRAWGNYSQVSSPVIIQWAMASARAGGVGSIVDLTTGKAQSTCSLTGANYPVGSLQRQFLSGVGGVTKSALYFAATPFVAGHQYQLRINGGAVTTFWASGLPSPLSVTAVAAHGAVDMSWTASSPGAGSVTTYLPRAYTGVGCTGTLVSYTVTTATSVRLSGLTTNQVYYVRVAARNGTTAGRWSPCQAVRII
jgi:uncharacterized protein YkwD